MDDKHAFEAVYGRTRIRANSFQAVGDELAGRGFVMHQAVHVDAWTIRVPHTDPARRPATLKKHEPEQPVEPVVVDPVIVALQETAALVTHGGDGVALATRDCGAVHPDGVCCFISVFFESLTCGCGDRVYEHDGPHEAVTPDGVRYRWEEVLTVQDLPYNAYGPLDMAQ